MTTNVIDFTVFLDGKGYLGKANSVTPPVVREQTTDVNAGGLGGTKRVPLGRVDPMESSFVLRTFDGEIEKHFAEENVSLVFRGVGFDDDGKEHSITYKMRGRINQIDNGTITPGSEAEVTATMDVHKYTKEIDQLERIHVDIEGRILRRNGVDVWSGIRQILGA